MLKHTQTAAVRPLEATILPSNGAVDLICPKQFHSRHSRPEADTARPTFRRDQYHRTGNFLSGDQTVFPRGECEPVTLQSYSLNSSPCSSYDSSSSAYSSLDAREPVSQSPQRLTQTNFSRRWKTEVKKESPLKPISVTFNIKNQEPPSHKYDYTSLPNSGELQAVGKIITRIQILDQSENSKRISIQNSLNAQKTCELNQTNMKSPLLKHEVQNDTKGSQSKTPDEYRSLDKDNFPAVARKSKIETDDVRLRSRSCESRGRREKEASKSLTVSKPSHPSISEKFSARDKICLGKNEKPLRRIVHFNDDEINNARWASPEPTAKKRVEIRKNENDDLTYVNVDEIGQKRTLSGVLHRSFRSGRSLTRSLGKSLRRSEHFKRPPIVHQRFGLDIKNDKSNPVPYNENSQAGKEAREQVSARQRSSSESRAKSSSRGREIFLGHVGSTTDSSSPSKSKSIFRTSLKRSFQKRAKRANSIAKDFKVEMGSDFGTETSKEQLNSVRSDDNNNKKKPWTRISFIGTKRETYDSSKSSIDVSHYDVPKPSKKSKQSCSNGPTKDASSKTNVTQANENSERKGLTSELKCDSKIPKSEEKQLCSAETRNFTEGKAQLCSANWRATKLSSGHEHNLASKAQPETCAGPASLQPTSPVLAAADEGKKLAVRVWVRCLMQDMEYKTLHVTPSTTASEVVHSILSKFRMKHRDPNLFYLALEVVISKNDGPTSTTVPLSDTARPSALLECQPCSSSRLTLRMRRGGVIRIHDAVLAQGSQYKSLLVSGKSDCLHVIGLVLACNHLKETKPDDFVLIQVTKTTGLEIRLLPHDRPLAVVQSWPSEDHAHLHIRPAVEQPSRPLSTTVGMTNLVQSRSSLANELEAYLTKDFLEDQRTPSSIPDVISLEARLKLTGKPSDAKPQFSDSNGASAAAPSCLRDDSDVKNIYEICGLQNGGDTRQRNEYTEDEANHLYSNGDFLEKAGMIAGRRTKDVENPPSPPSRAPRIPSRRKGVWSLNPDLLEAATAPPAADETDLAKNRRTLSYNDYENYFYI